jgi:hypothetical protein
VGLNLSSSVSGCGGSITYCWIRQATNEVISTFSTATAPASGTYELYARCPTNNQVTYNTITI